MLLETLLVIFSAFSSIVSTNKGKKGDPVRAEIHQRTIDIVRYVYYYLTRRGRCIFDIAPLCTIFTNQYLLLDPKFMQRVLTDDFCLSARSLSVSLSYIWESAHCL